MNFWPPRCTPRAPEFNVGSATPSPNLRNYFRRKAAHADGHADFFNIELRGYGGHHRRQTRRAPFFHLRNNFGQQYHNELAVWRHCHLHGFNTTDGKVSDNDTSERYTARLKRSMFCRMDQHSPRCDVLFAIFVAVPTQLHPKALIRWLCAILYHNHTLARGLHINVSHNTCVCVSICP